jgi:hypothetical protein
MRAGFRTETGGHRPLFHAINPINNFWLTHDSFGWRKQHRIGERW